MNNLGGVAMIEPKGRAMDHDPWLFQGEIINGRLSNEVSLIRDCPVEFLTNDNPWKICTMTLLRGLRVGYVGVLNPWVWRDFTASKRRNELEAQRRENCFRGLLYAHRSGLSFEERAAVLAWMLSEILVSVPEYIRRDPPN